MKPILLAALLLAVGQCLADTVPIAVTNLVVVTPHADGYYPMPSGEILYNFPDRTLTQQVIRVTWGTVECHDVYEWLRSKTNSFSLASYLTNDVPCPQLINGGYVRTDCKTNTLGHADTVLTPENGEGR